jgi:RecB family exonuclease
MKTYSYSKLSTFEQCPFKFKLRYIDKIPPEIEKTIEAHLGKTIHSALEWFYSRIKENTIPSLDQLISFYIKTWHKEFAQNTQIIDKTLTAKDYFNKGINFLADYYLTNKPFDDNTLEVEKKIKLNLGEEEQYKIYGYVDRLSYNPKTREYEIHDYKTANNLPKKQRLENDKQLPLYSLAIKDLFGQDKEVRLIWHFLAHNKKIHFKKTNDELETLKKETLKLIKEIEQATEFSKTPSPLCNWCEYKNLCQNN